MPKIIELGFAWFGSAFALGVIAYLAHATGNPLLMAPLGASAVLAFGVPESPLAQPRNIVGGHFLSAITGFAFVHMLGTDWWVGVLAVATAIVVMQVTKTTHPPAGANPLIIHMAVAPWSFVFIPVLLSACLLAGLAVVFHRVVSGKQYPTHFL